MGAEHAKDTSFPAKVIWLVIDVPDETTPVRTIVLSFKHRAERKTRRLRRLHACLFSLAAHCLTNGGALPHEIEGQPTAAMESGVGTVRGRKSYSAVKPTPVTLSPSDSERSGSDFVGHWTYDIERRSFHVVLSCCSCGMNIVTHHYLGERA